MPKKREGEKKHKRKTSILKEGGVGLEEEVTVRNTATPKDQPEGKGGQREG